MSGARTGAAGAGGVPDPRMPHPTTREEVETLERVRWRDWPIERITEHAATIMAGTPGRARRGVSVTRFGDQLRSGGRSVPR